MKKLDREMKCEFADLSMTLQMHLQSHTHHIIQVTKTIVASLNELKKRIRSSPSWPSFFSATPKTRANITSPRMFIPSISVPKGICRDKKKRRLVRIGQKPKKRVTSFCCCSDGSEINKQNLLWKGRAYFIEGNQRIWRQFRYKPP